MSRAVALSALMSRIRWQADSPGTARLVDADLITEINASWQAMRELTADNGHKLYLTAASGTLTPGVVGGADPIASFGSLSLPADCARIYGIDVVFNGIRRPLAAGEFQERDEYYDAFGNTTGVPVQFHVYNIGVETATSIGTGSVALFPAPDQPYPYTLWYLPNWTNITNTTFVFNGLAGWDDWVVWHVVLKIAARDNDMANTAQIAMAGLAEAEKRVLKGADSVQRVGPSKKVDAAAIARRNQRDVFWRRPL